MSVEIGGAQLADELRGKQVPLLLAYLLLNRDRHVGREELIGALWPERAPRSEDAALRTLLSRLRSALGSSSLAGRDGLMLNLPEPVWIDLEAASVEVRRAQETLDRGDVRSAWALAQVPLNIASRGLLPGSQASWLEPRRRELEDIRLHALELIGRAGLHMGGTQLQSVQRAARSLIDAEPYRESGYVLLMEAFAAEGNVAEGLRVFERLRAMLRDELGTTPSPETIAAHERLLRPRARGRARQRTAGEPPRATVELPADLLTSAEGAMVGRKHELGELWRLWTNTRGDQAVTTGDSAASGPSAEPYVGSRQIVLLAGDPGIGKTRLVAELARRAHDDGALVLAGRAPEETVVPYQPLLEALRHYLVNAPLEDVLGTAREYVPELARLVPELRRRAPDLPHAPSGEPETERYRLFEAVVGLLRAISVSVPILLVLDDLQWADRPSRLLLRHLARAADPARLLVVGAYRLTETSSQGFTDALAEARRDRIVTQIDLGGLSESETAELVRLRTGKSPSQPFSRALHEQTEGNPLFIEEIVRHLNEAGIDASGASASTLRRAGLPEGIKAVIARRLARLDSQAMEWLRVAAVIGRDFEASLLERVVPLGEDEFLNALDEALATGLIIELAAEPGRYTFSHALIRETLYEGMSAPRRARIHRRVGEALEALEARSAVERRTSSRDAPLLAALAHHFTRAAGPEDAERAITYARRAGDQATVMLAHEEAAEHYARALEVLERFDEAALERHCELLLLLGEAQVRAGERALAWPAFHRAAALAEDLGDRDSLARAAVGASRRYVQQPGVIDTELISMLKRALAMSAGERTLERVRVLGCLCGALYYSPERDQMRSLSDEATVIARELREPEALACGCAARRRALWDPDHLGERLEASTEMLRHARQAGNLELELQAHALLVVDLLEHGRREAVDAQIDAFTAGAAALRQPLYLWNTLVWMAMSALLGGQLEEAEQLTSEALAAGVPAEAVSAPHGYAAQMLAIRREQCRLGELEQAARGVLEANPARPGWSAAVATLLCEIGEREHAQAQFEQLAAQDFRDFPKDLDWLSAMTLAADAALALGDTPRASVLHEMLTPYAGSHVVVGLGAVCLGSVKRYLGKLAAAIGRSGEAIEHFEDALEANRALNAPVIVAHTQLDYATALASGEKADRLIDAAARTADELALPWVAGRAEQLRSR